MANRTERIEVRITKSDKADFQQAAAADKYNTTAAWLRDLALRRIAVLAERCVSVDGMCE
jgi:uncharacterized protein (DUF1778 family)